MNERGLLTVGQSEGQSEFWRKKQSENDSETFTLTFALALFFVAGDRFELPTFGLWAQRAATAPPRTVSLIKSAKIDNFSIQLQFWQKLFAQAILSELLSFAGCTPHLVHLFQN